MKLIITSVFMLAMSTFMFGAVQSNWVSLFKDNVAVQSLQPEMAGLAMDQFLSLTPNQYKEMTGQKLSIKQVVQLKAAQKFVKNQTNKKSDISKGVYVLLAIFGLAWLAMGIMDDWSGDTWLINLLLSFLCWLPGLIHALVSMKKYY
jgi:uncharacterized membrane protein YqaE (UPF0057 family)